MSDHAIEAIAAAVVAVCVFGRHVVAALRKPEPTPAPIPPRPRKPAPKRRRRRRR